VARIAPASLQKETTFQSLSHWGALRIRHRTTAAGLGGFAMLAAHGSKVLGLSGG